jgi:hypothetical protein
MPKRYRPLVADLVPWEYKPCNMRVRLSNKIRQCSHADVTNRASLEVKFHQLVGRCHGIHQSYNTGATQRSVKRQPFRYINATVNRCTVSLLSMK